MHFFGVDKNTYAKGMQWLVSRMPESEPNLPTTEKTPKYVISEEVPARIPRIHRMNSSIAVKLKTVNRRQNFTKLFLSNTGYVNTNYCPVYVTTYHIHLARWLKLFPQTQIHFVDGDRLISEPLQELRAVKKSCGFPHFSQRM
ncbi:hypothetical protein RRG08_041324 [Elysia crispata]|uniref:Sulfotransferase domain-containing protein n=1 Tax=Elysia crispata TaxID=231223 RepID=A0AAE0YUY8_9GAST|nr:hypothetical protein RRG08_041324 [Elysia crispata]